MRSFTPLPPRPGRVTDVCRSQAVRTRKENAASFDGKRVFRLAARQRCGRSDRAAMNRRLVWIEQEQFRGFGCSDCAWAFKSSGPPAGKSFDDMMRNFELQRDREFALHVCANHPRGRKKAE